MVGRGVFGEDRYGWQDTRQITREENKRIGLAATVGLNPQRNVLTGITRASVLGDPGVRVVGKAGGFVGEGVGAAAKGTSPRSWKASLFFFPLRKNLG